jgi:hypothetical protein
VLMPALLGLLCQLRLLGLLLLYLQPQPLRVRRLPGFVFQLHLYRLHLLDLSARRVKRAKRLYLNDPTI